MNSESVPSEAGPDLDGIEQGISNYEVEIASACGAGLAMTNDFSPPPNKFEGATWRIRELVN